MSNLPNNRPNLPDQKQAQTRRFQSLFLSLYIERSPDTVYRHERKKGIGSPQNRRKYSPFLRLFDLSRAWCENKGLDPDIKRPTHPLTVWSASVINRSSRSGNRMRFCGIEIPAISTWNGNPASTVIPPRLSLSSSSPCLTRITPVGSALPPKSCFSYVARIVENYSYTFLFEIEISFFLGGVDYGL